MVDLADKIVSVIGGFAQVPNARVAQEVARRGGVVRRGLPQRTAIVAVGRRSLAQLADGRLQAKLARAEQIGAECLSENTLLRMLDLLPRRVLPARARSAWSNYRSGSGSTRRWCALLVLYDIIQPCGGECGFRDLIGAREVARLLGEGLDLADIVRSAERLGCVGERRPSARPPQAGVRRRAASSLAGSATRSPSSTARCGCRCPTPTTRRSMRCSMRPRRPSSPAISRPRRRSIGAA